MRPIQAEFVRHVPTRWPWLVMTGVFLAVAAWQGYEAWFARGSALAVEQEMVTLRFQISAARATASAASAKAIASPQVDEVIVRTMRFDWNGVFASIHAARVPGVRLSSVDISAKDGAVRVEVEAPRTDDILLYLSAINEGEPEPRWQLMRMQTGSGASPATATIEALPGSFRR